MLIVYPHVVFTFCLPYALEERVSDDLTWNPDTIAYVDWEKKQNSPVRTSDGKNSG